LLRKELLNNGGTAVGGIGVAAVGRGQKTVNLEIP